MLCPAGSFTLLSIKTRDFDRLSITTGFKIETGTYSRWPVFLVLLFLQLFDFLHFSDPWSIGFTVGSDVWLRRVFVADIFLLPRSNIWILKDHGFEIKYFPSETNLIEE